MSDDATIDWRIGKRVKLKYRRDCDYGKTGVVAAVHPSGTLGQHDPAGILEVRWDDGGVALRPADAWVSA